MFIFWSFLIFIKGLNAKILSYKLGSLLSGCSGLTSYVNVNVLAQWGAGNGMPSVAFFSFSEGPLKSDFISV
jgi:hypothetical protein